MKKQGLLFFMLGVACGVLGNYAAKKMKNLQVFPEDWFEDDYDEE